MIVQTLQSWNRLSFKPKFAVIVIFDHEGASVGGPIKNGHSPFQGHRYTQRELVSRS